MADRQYILWGSAGHAKVLAEIIAAQGDTLVALVDNNPEAHAIAPNLLLLQGESGLKQWLADKDAADFHALVAIGGGRGSDRLQLHHLLHSLGFKTDPLLHDSALVSPSAQVGAGCQLLGHSLLAAEAVLGEACILNHKASVDHESMLGNGIHLAPGVTVCGCVKLGDKVFVGAGATILPRVSVGSNTVIGAGSVVTTDIPANVVVYGNPAKVIRSNP